jgi:uncharacterized protein
MIFTIFIKFISYIKKPKAIIIILCNVLLLSGCNSYPTLLPNFYGKKNSMYLTKEAEKYLKIAKNCPDQYEKNHLLLLSAELLINANNAQDAEKILSELNNNLTPSQYAKKQIFLAKISLSQSNVSKARELLADIGSYQNIDQEVYKQLYSTKAAMFLKTGDILESLQELTNLDNFLPTEQEKHENAKNIWSQLQQLTPNFLNGANQGNFSQTMHGWLSIAYITKQYDAYQEELYDAVKTWQSSFPKHPAKYILDLNITDGSLRSYSENQRFNDKENVNQHKIDLADKFRHVNKIALLLPMSGSYDKSATAIKNGFLAASYNKKSEIKKPEIIILDTHKQNINNIYEAAINQGADLIVGPLIKDDVEKLARFTTISKPTIALNTVKGVHSTLLFQFGLPPETEAHSMVEKAIKNNHQNALFIVQDTELGRRILNAVSKNWQSAEGKIVSIVHINDKTNLNNTLKNVLGIEDSNFRAKELNRLGIKFNFEPRRRQDLDCIFLITNPDNARQIKPLLNFYYATKIPIYASSWVHSGYNPSLNRDLDGVQFCDIPWMLDDEVANYTIYKDTKNLWKENFSQYSRLYALGIDAYKLCSQIPQLLNMPKIGISGMTGVLKIDDNNVINRQLIWGTFDNGLVTVLNQKN